MGKPVITAEALRASRWRLTLHARLAKGGSLYAYGCDEHPRIAYSKSRQTGSDRFEIRFTVDGHLAASIEEAVDLLNGPVREPPPPAAKPMKACTVWQPWASLIIIGAKPFEFRTWDYRPRYPGLVGQRIVIHAGARRMRRHEVGEILFQLACDESSLVREPARKLLVSVGFEPGDGGLQLPLSHGLGTAILGEPRLCTELFRGTIHEERIDPEMWAWPLTDIEPWIPPVPSRGAQGFWNWTGDVPERVAA
jgi:hypothetical protein